MRVLQSNTSSDIIYSLLSFFIVFAGVGTTLLFVSVFDAQSKQRHQQLPFGKYNDQDFILCKINVGNVFANAAPHIDISRDDDAINSFAGANCARNDIYIIRDGEPIINVAVLTGKNLSFIKQKEYFINAVLDLVEPKDIVATFDRNNRERILICIGGQKVERN